MLFLVYYVDDFKMKHLIEIDNENDIKFLKERFDAIEIKKIK